MVWPSGSKGEPSRAVVGFIESLATTSLSVVGRRWISNRMKPMRLLPLHGVLQGTGVEPLEQPLVQGGVDLQPGLHVLGEDDPPVGDVTDLGPLDLRAPPPGDPPPDRVPVGEEPGPPGVGFRVLRLVSTDHATPPAVRILTGPATRSWRDVSSFHEQFRTVTAMSPIQYQKRLRLQEARLRLFRNPRDVAAVGYSVGYGSASQFSREYRREFGVPPSEDALRMREHGQVTA
jgi:hypothetical protein